MSTDKARVHLIVEGRVQGVGFRYYTQAEAKAMGLTGWVKNLPDRSVEIVAEGPPNQLVKLANWARQGPLSAQVTEVHTRWLPFMGELTEFRIRKD